MVFWALVALFVFVIYYANQYYFSYWKRLGVPQQDAPTFLLGDLAGIFSGKRKCFGETFFEFYNRFKHNKIYGLYFSYRPSLIVNDPEVIQEVMIKDFTSFHDRGLFVDEKVDPLSAHLFFLGGQKWRDLRVKLSPMFTSGKLKAMYPIIQDCAKQLHDYLLKNTQEKKSFDFDAKDLFARFTINVISSVAFGIENDCINDPENIFHKMGVRIFERRPRDKIVRLLGFFVPKIVDKLKVKKYHPEIEDFFHSIVKQNIDLREQGGSLAERKDFMQLLVQLKNQGYVTVDKSEEHEVDNATSTERRKLTFQEVASQVFVFFIGGFETSSSTMNYCMYELSKNPHVQKKLHEELDNHLKSIDDLTYDTLSSMKYLDWCVDETLRKYPIVPMLNRESSRDHHFAGTNMKIEKGTPIIIPVLGIHRDPKIYDNPMEFRPERFANSSAGSPNVNGLCYMGFGDGPRSCIAARLGKLQTKIGLAAILLKLKFELADQSMMDKELEFDPHQFALTPKDTVMLRATVR
ncbi:probable cytochrome P450 6a14 [Bradysia coprophila]|uniref:probable cytochrome P450 6a14 n=1 Tax=Bradysia coprophila TaxID=38358 RepID=UPI00187DD40F|nr:probable cytochrome P450 6a14 [Bradysia coprophila]